MKPEEESNWSYDPSAQQNSSTKTETRSVGWTASEYIDHKQGAGWFALLGLATLVLAAIIYVLTRDYFATVIIIVLGVIVGIFARRTPRQLDYRLSPDGLKIGDKQYSFGEFKSFSIIQEGPISSIDLMPLKRFMPPISAYFETTDQKKIVGVLENYLPYEERQLDKVERLARRLRF